MRHASGRVLAEQSVSASLVGQTTGVKTLYAIPAGKWLHVTDGGVSISAAPTTTVGDSSVTMATQYSPMADQTGKALVLCVADFGLATTAQVNEEQTLNAAIGADAWIYGGPSGQNITINGVSTSTYLQCSGWLRGYIWDTVEVTHERDYAEEFWRQMREAIEEATGAR